MIMSCMFFPNYSQNIYLNWLWFVTNEKRYLQVHFDYWTNFERYLRKTILIFHYPYSFGKKSWDILSLNCSPTDLATDLVMVWKYKFVCYGHIKKKLALYVPLFNSDGPLKSKVSHFKNMRFFNFQALDPNFVLALEPRVLKLEGSSYANQALYLCPKGVL